MLVNVMSVVDTVTSTVPLPVMVLMNSIRAGELPDGVAVLQVMPCSEVAAPAGQRIFSLWQGPDVEAVAAAVETVIGDHCTSTLYPVMEDFAHGVTRESLGDAALRVARRTGAKMIQLDEKLGVSASVTAAGAAVSVLAVDASNKVSERAAPVLQKVSESEVVQKMNNKVQDGLNWMHGRLNAKTADTKVNAPEQITQVASREGGAEGQENAGAAAEEEAEEAAAEAPPDRGARAGVAPASDPSRGGVAQTRPKHDASPPRSFALYSTHIMYATRFRTPDGARIAGVLFWTAAAPRGVPPPPFFSRGQSRAEMFYSSRPPSRRPPSTPLSLSLRPSLPLSLLSPSFPLSLRPSLPLICLRFSCRRPPAWSNPIVRTDRPRPRASFPRTTFGRGARTSPRARA